MKHIIEKQLNNFDDLTITAEVSNISTKMKNYNELIADIKQNYNLKSSNYFNYFINNILFSKNRLTNDYYINHYNNDNYFRYINNFEVDRKKGKYTIIEDSEGHYLAQQDRLYALKIYSKVNYLEFINEGTIKQFITLTLPSEYHRYKLKNNVKNKTYKQSNFIKNNNYAFDNIDFEEAIEKGIAKLNEIERRLQIEFNKYATRYIKKNYNMTFKEYKEKYNSNVIQKIKMIEPHKSLTPHLHALYWIEPEFVEIFNRVYSNIIKLYNLNDDFCQNETIEEAKASTYIMKYIMKNLDNDKEEKDTDTTFANKYRRYFSKSRFFTTSNFKHTTQKEIDFLYKYLNKHNKEFLSYLKDLKEPLYWSLEQLILKKVITYEYDFKIVENDKSRIIEKQIEELNKIDEIKETQLKNLELEKQEIINFYYSSDLHPSSYNFNHKLFPKKYYKEIKKENIDNQYNLMFDYMLNKESKIEEKINYLKEFNLNNELNKIEEQIKQGTYIKETVQSYIKEVSINLKFTIAVSDNKKDYKKVLENINDYIDEDYCDTIYIENSFISSKLDYEKVCEIIENPFKKDIA